MGWQQRLRTGARGRFRREVRRDVVSVVAVVGMVGLVATLVLRSSERPVVKVSEEGAAGHGCRRPYAAFGPWNTPIPAGARTDPSRTLPPGQLTSDPTQYTYPVYDVSGATPAVTVRIRDTYSNVVSPTRLEKQFQVRVRVPLPTGAVPSGGSDGQLVLVRPKTGDEWGFWRLDRVSGEWSATNAYHFNTRWSGVPPPGFGSRGAGVPYLAGLIRRCEIERGHIDHALALAYAHPSPAFVYPARKSDGLGSADRDFPEGTRLQLDPSLGGADLAALGIAGPALTIARALQKYGAYVVDNSGHAKLYAEDDLTANWRGLLTSATVRSIPVSAFRAVVDERPTTRALSARGTSGSRIDLRYVVLDGGQTREAIVVMRHATVIARLRSGFHDASRGLVSTVTWRPPAGLAGSLRFCVTSTDAAGQLSAPTCASLNLQRGDGSSTAGRA